MIVRNTKQAKGDVIWWSATPRNHQRVSVGIGIPSSRYECVMQVYFLTRESVSRYKQPLRLCIRNNIQGLRTLNIIVFTFFYNINKGNLPLMYSCVFWCEFIDLVVFFFVLWREWPGSHNNVKKTPHQTTEEYIKGKSPLFILLKKRKNNDI